MPEQSQPPEGAPEPPAESNAPEQTPEQRQHTGRIRYQDPDTAQPKPLSVAEQRARQRAADEEAAREQAEEEAAQRKRKIRKRVMIGGGVTVGVAALVAAYYAMKPDDVTAHCTDQNGTVQDDRYCDAGYASGHNGYLGSGGLIFLPIPGGGLRSYHYTYGGTVSGGHVSGGTLTAPGGANIKTDSGKTIQRGGFGVSGGKSGGSGTGGGKSGGS